MKCQVLGRKAPRRVDGGGQAATGETSLSCAATQFQRRTVPGHGAKRSTRPQEGWQRPGRRGGQGGAPAPRSDGTSVSGHVQGGSRLPPARQAFQTAPTRNRVGVAPGPEQRQAGRPVRLCAVSSAGLDAAGLRSRTQFRTAEKRGRSSPDPETPATRCGSCSGTVCSAALPAAPGPRKVTPEGRILHMAALAPPRPGPGSGGAPANWKLAEGLEESVAGFPSGQRQAPGPLLPAPHSHVGGLPRRREGHSPLLSPQPVGGSPSFSSLHTVPALCARNDVASGCKY